jgi:hypothetical protein
MNSVQGLWGRASVRRTLVALPDATTRWNGKNQPNTDHFNGYDNSARTAGHAMALATSPAALDAFKVFPDFFACP